MTFELINDTGGPAAAFPSRLARWLRPRTELIGTLVALRQSGHAPDGVAALLALPDVQALRAEWEDWLTVVDDADRAASLLRTTVPAEILADSIYAFWNISVRTVYSRRHTRRNIWPLAACEIHARSPRAPGTGGGPKPC